MNSYNSSPYVFSEEDLFGEEEENEEDTTPKIEIDRWVSTVSSDQCFFLYAFVAPEHGSDVMVRRDAKGRFHFTLGEIHQSVDQFPVVEWMISVAKLIIQKFDFYWSNCPDDWNLPPHPEGWNLTVN